MGTGYRPLPILQSMIALRYASQQVIYGHCASGLGAQVHQTCYTVEELSPTLTVEQTL
jgi:hypothetical protein